MDLPLWPRVTIRAFEADYVLAHQNFADLAAAGSDARQPNFAGVRLRGGVLFNFRLARAAAATARGQLLAATERSHGRRAASPPPRPPATSIPSIRLTYDWSSNGGKISGKDNTANIDTNGLAGGSYTVTAHITDAKDEKRRARRAARRLSRLRSRPRIRRRCRFGRSHHAASRRNQQSFRYLHQPGQCSGHGERLDRQRRQRLRQRKHRNPEYYGRIRRADHGERNLYGFARA